MFPDPRNRKIFDRKGRKRTVDNDFYRYLVCLLFKTRGTISNIKDLFDKVQHVENVSAGKALTFFRSIRYRIGLKGQKRQQENTFLGFYSMSFSKTLSTGFFTSRSRSPTL